MKNLNKYLANNINEWCEKLDGTTSVTLTPMEVLEIKDLLEHCRRAINNISNENYDNESEVKRQAKAAIEEHMTKLGIKK